MSQYDFGVIDPTIVDGTTLAAMLNSWRDALYTMQRGSTRPAFVVPGQLWCNDTAGPSNWIVNYYVSATIGDVPLFAINTVSGAITWRGGLLGGPFLALAGGIVTGPTSFADTLSALAALWSDAPSGQPLHIFRAQANSSGQRIVELVENADGSFSIRALSDDQTTLQGEVKVNRDGTMAATTPPGGASGIEVATAAWVRALVPALGLGMPPGVVVPFAVGGAAPAGWLLCAGQAVSRTTYAALYAVLGTGYGAGDGSTTFGLPDLRGRAVFGGDAMGGIAANRLGGAGAAPGGVGGGDPGWTGGEQSHVLTPPEGPNMPLSGTTGPVTWNGTDTYMFGGGQNGFYFGYGDANLSTYNRLSITGTTSGGGGKHNNMPPAIVLNYIIKT